MSDELMAHMRARVAQCRRLAATTTDKRTEAILLQMAAEGEADIQRLEAERAGMSSEPIPQAPPPAKA